MLLGLPSQNLLAPKIFEQVGGGFSELRGHYSGCLEDHGELISRAEGLLGEFLHTLGFTKIRSLSRSSWFLGTMGGPSTHASSNAIFEECSSNYDSRP